MEFHLYELSHISADVHRYGEGWFAEATAGKETLSHQGRNEGKRYHPGKVRSRDTFSSRAAFTPASGADAICTPMFGAGSLTRRSARSSSSRRWSRLFLAAPVSPCSTLNGALTRGSEPRNSWPRRLDFFLYSTFSRIRRGLRHRYQPRLPLPCRLFGFPVPCEARKRGHGHPVAHPG